MSKIIAIANHKGGVGKTTSTVNIGALLAKQGYKVLVIDLDPQANLTKSLLQGNPSTTIYEALTEQKGLPIYVLREHLSIVPSSMDLAGVELQIANNLRREYILKKLLKPVRDRYDFILCDCAPTLGLTTVNALTAADDVLIPLTPEILPYKGLEEMHQFISMIQEELNTELKLAGIFLTRYERNNLAQEVEEEIRTEYGELVYKTKIRKNVAVALAPIEQTDVTTSAPNSKGAEDYQTLTAEIIEREARI